MRSLNPASAPIDRADAAARRWLQPLVFETLVALDPAGGLRPMLATAWEHDPAWTRWRFQLRSGVKLHDGSALDAGRVAAALRGHERSWTVAADAASVTIASVESAPDLLWELADGRYAIAFARPEGGEPIGTGPFAIERWEPRRLRLRAHDEHWGGRPFVDAVHIEMARSPADQITSLDLGRADFVGLQPQDVRRVTQRGRTLAESKPLELVALVFEGRGTSEAFRPVRRALSLAIDRAAMCAVLLQRHAQPAMTLLPEWIGGYSALLARDVDRAAARRSVAALTAADRRLTLGIDSTDATLRAIAERIVVDATDAGFSIALAQSRSSASRPADARLIAVRLEATPRERALRHALAALGLQPRGLVLPEPGDSVESSYRFERDLRDQDLFVPVVHLPDLYVAAPAVESWREALVSPSGAWNFAMLWMRPATP